MDSFGKRLRDAITAAEITQEQLGDEVGRSKGAVTQWVQDKTEPDLQTLAKICERLKVSADYLVRGVESQYMDAQTAQIAARVQALSEPNREGLHKLIFGVGVKDDEVERRMPITKKLQRAPRK